MKIFFMIYLVCLLSGCAINRVPSLNMLDRRSDYTEKLRAEKELSSLSDGLLIPHRVQPEITDVWIHPHEMPTGDYFLGGWVRIVISDSRWQIKNKFSF